MTTPKLKRGDIREDGFIFHCYDKHQLKSGDVAIYEKWLSPEAFEALLNREKKTRLDPNRKQYIKEYMKSPKYAIQKKLYNASRYRDPNVRAKMLEYKKEYNQRKSSKKIKAQWESAKKKNDLIYGLAANLRSRIATSLKNIDSIKQNKTAEILGCSFEFFKAYIEQRFLPGMGWHNRSEWHLDHIIPVSSAKTEKHLLKLNHYTNFRPLWAKDNLSKGCKVESQLTLLAA